MFTAVGNLMANYSFAKKFSLNLFIVLHLLFILPQEDKKV